MNNTYRIYNIHMVHGRVLSTPICPVLVDKNLQPLSFFIVPVAVERDFYNNKPDPSKRFYGLRVNQQNVMFIDETTIVNSEEIQKMETLFSFPTVENVVIE